MTVAPDLRAHIHGGLAGVATGDALGFPAHDLHHDEIRARWHGVVDRMVDAFPDDPIHLGYRAGQITDDTILTLVTAEAILADPEPTAQSVARRLAEWAAANRALWETGSVFGPSTKGAFAALLAGGGPWAIDRSRLRSAFGASNGAAMRVSPAGFVHPGDIAAAVRTACTVVAPTHGTHVAFAAAGAQAAAVAAALAEGADVFSVVAAAFEGARVGEAIGRREARVVPAPSIQRRLELAVGIALSSGDAFEAGERLHDVIGTNLPAAEALPSAVGLFVAGGGDPRTVMAAAATAGGDTDTCASIAGALAGSLRGIGAVPEEWVRLVEKVNGLDLGELAGRLHVRGAGCVSPVGEEWSPGEPSP